MAQMCGGAGDVMPADEEVKGYCNEVGQYICFYVFHINIIPLYIYENRQSLEASSIYFYREIV